KTVSAGLQFQVSYTYSKALSDADQTGAAQTLSTAATAQDLNNLAQDYGLSAYDQRQTLVANGKYQMPWDKFLGGRVAKEAIGGWSINGIFSYGTWLPIDIELPFNNSRNGDSRAPDRPDLVAGARNNPVHGVSVGCQGFSAGQKLRTPALWF